MLSELKLTDDEIAEAARLLKSMQPEPNKREDSFWQQVVIEQIEVLTCIAQVVDKRKEKEIG